MRVLVTGGRTYTDFETVDKILSGLIPRVDIKQEIIVIHGGAMGADWLAEIWCLKNGIHSAKVDANWPTYSDYAGPLRNSTMMLLEPHILVAFPGGHGTADMLRKARAAGIEVIEVKA